MRRVSTLAILLAVGCAGGETTPATSFTSTSGVGSGSGSDTEVDTAISATAGDTDGGADDSSGGEPGPAARPGIGAAGIVSAGGRASSASYSVVFSMGQSSVPTGTHASSSYTVHGGLIGANGSPPQ